MGGKETDAMNLYFEILNKIPIYNTHIFIPIKKFDIWLVVSFNCTTMIITS